MHHHARQSSGRVDLDHAVSGPALTRRRSSEVPIGAVAATAAERSQFEDLAEAALSQCAAELPVSGLCSAA
jgi:hypothetical protein